MKTRNNELFLSDILGCCEKIESYLQGVNEVSFHENMMLQDALVRNIEIIGEAAKNLTKEFRENNSQIVWSDIMRMRDKIVHHYFRVDFETIWQQLPRIFPN